MPIDAALRRAAEDWIAADPDPPAAAWNELVAQPDPLLHDAGFYDALRKTAGIPLGGAVSGFAVQFDWLGSGSPGGQPFDIIDPVTFQPVYSGTTLPEPGTAAVLGLLAAASLRRRGWHGHAPRLHLAMDGWSTRGATAGSRCFISMFTCSPVAG